MSPLPPGSAMGLGARLAALLLGGLLLAAPAMALEVPLHPEGRVNDYAGLLQAPDRQRIEQRLRGIEETNSNQFVVAIFPSLEGDSLEEFSIRLAEAWKVGQAERDNGLILLLFTEDRKVRIEVGYGLEGAITDATSGRVIRDVLAPRFREGDYAGGILAAVESLDKASRGEFEALPRSRAPSAIGRFPFLLVFFVIAGVLSALRRAVFLGGRGTHRRGGGIWWMGTGGGFGGRGGFGGGGGVSGGGGGFGGGGASGGW